MKLTSLKIALRSLFFHRKESIYQLAIVSILTAIICGSLLTGFSVRNSLEKNLEEKRGHADYLISSGLRYFDASTAGRFTKRSGLKSAGIIETDGYCSNFTSGETALNIKIYGTDTSFFTFHGHSSVQIPEGSALINKNLAEKLKLTQGDEVILGFNSINPLPSNVPFAPEEGGTESKVLRVAGIISGNEGGSFSLGSSQAQESGVFVNMEDLTGETKFHSRINRLLVHADRNFDNSQILNYFKEILTPADIGLTVRKSRRTGESELISDRIFIDSALVGEIEGIFPASAPLITYLGNSFSIKSKSTPYSFITALPSELFPGIEDNEIVIGSWLANDLDANPGDTLNLTWFNPVAGRSLREVTASFIIKGIEDNNFKYSDPSLMPEFPGIAGSTTCSSWDAGVQLDMKRIRPEDEDYWSKYKGTPKAFINYGSGLKIWGNNFGPATAIRFTAGEDSSAIITKLTGNISPSLAGFAITDLRNRSLKASSGGVDFGMLFIGLSFFIIMSCIILLSMALKLFLDSRKDEIRAYHALGFRNGKITWLIFQEAFFISITGALLGSIIGYLVNILIINALNSVWTGAVQTDTLLPGFSFVPTLMSIITAIIIASLMVVIRLRNFLSELAQGSRVIYKPTSYGKTGLYFILSLFISISLLILSVIFRNSSTILAFSGGSMVIISLILASYRFFLGRKKISSNYSGLYYSYYPSRAVTPVIFIAAGIFAVIITGANRQVVSERMSLPSGGTGGYLIWAESALPVNHDLNSRAGRAEFGFDDEDLVDMTFVQARKLRGDDASCLNITYVSAPPLLGIDGKSFIDKGSFSFATKIRMPEEVNPWSLLDEKPDDNIIYGIADQTVLQWGLKIKTGDTLKYVSENGQLLNIVICAGLKSSVFQGHLLIGSRSFEKHFPSVPGYSVFLVDGKREKADLYKSVLIERLSGYGISAEPAIEKLASFFQVTNTYLDVFMMMGVFGMMLGVAGLGFILLRNFNSRKREFALMLASGYTVRRIRRLLLKDHFLILMMGIFTGSISAISATWPSVAGGTELPWGLFSAMLLLIFVTGFIVLAASVSMVNRNDIIVNLRGE